MEDNTGRSPQRGGSVEPANRAAVAIQHFQLPKSDPARRYELHDPRTDLTYGANTLQEMTAKADQIGAKQFVSVDPGGKRTPISRTASGWPEPDRAASQTLSTDKQPAARVVPIAGPTSSQEALVAKVDADAERQARVAQLETALNERYLIKRASIKVGEVTVGQNEYRHRGDPTKLAFTESTFRLSTDNNSPSVARSMVDVAEARNWHGLRVSGNEDFKRMVWLEASVRGVKTIGYEPVPRDLELLRKERESRQTNRLEPAASASTTAKQSARGGGGRKAVLVALEAVLVSKGVPEKQREAVMAAAAENLAQRIRNGETHRVKIYDRSAPAQQRPTPSPTREAQRARERTPTR
jgi:hypothetical protein